MWIDKYETSKYTGLYVNISKDKAVENNQDGA